MGSAIVSEMWAGDDQPPICRRHSSSTAICGELADRRNSAERTERHSLVAEPGLPITGSGIKGKTTCRQPIDQGTMVTFPPATPEARQGFPAYSNRDMNAPPSNLMDPTPSRKSEAEVR